MPSVTDKIDIDIIKVFNQYRNMWVFYTADKTTINNTKAQIGAVGRLLLSPVFFF